MDIDIETSFNIGDTVWWMGNDTSHSGKVLKIDIEIVEKEGNIEMEEVYYIDTNPFKRLTHDRLYRSKEALLDTWWCNRDELIEDFIEKNL